MENQLDIFIILCSILQYLSQCDTILYIKDGRIAERGLHNQLMRDNGVREYTLIIFLLKGCHKSAWKSQRILKF